MNDDIELMCASDVEEFFYDDSDFPVEDGDPIGVEIIKKNKIELVLFPNIYWSPPNE